MLGLTNTVTANELTFAAYPPLREGFRVPSVWRSVQPGERIDAVVLTAAVPDITLNLLLNNVADPLIPVVSFVADGRHWFDAAGLGEEATWDRAQTIQARLRELPDTVRHSSAPEDILLARMYSRDLSLAAVYDSGRRDLVCYPSAGRLSDVAEIALRLYNWGFVTRTFFDRVHCCPDCRSGHLSVREECHGCFSANIAEESLVHHFRCGHIAQESSFRSGSKFDCPKCGYGLRHIGLDYDKPGSMTRCDDCGVVNDKPAVGFKCVDCGAHHRPEAVPIKTWYSYALTSAGIQHLLAGETTAAHDLPQRGPTAFDLILEHAKREQREFKEPYQVAMITFTNQEKIERENHRLWAESMKLMTDALHSALREVDVVREEPQGFLVLMPRTDSNSAKRAMEFVQGRMTTILKIDPGFRYELLDTAGVRLLTHEAA